MKNTQSKNLKEIQTEVRKIAEAYQYLAAVNVANVEDVARVFGLASGQKFPPSLIADFKETKRQPLEFMCGDFLTSKGFKNIFAWTQLK